MTEFGHRLPRSFYAREPDVVGQDLVGRVLLAPAPHRGAAQIALRMTETEAYHGEQDPASHAYRGPTERTRVMFGPPGFVYVYFVYGMHWCANIVTGADGQAAAVLMRAARLLQGDEAVRERRRSATGRYPRPVDLARGPARLAQCLGLSGKDSGSDLLADGAPFTVHSGSSLRPKISSGPRVGVAAAADTPWRFCEVGEPTVSDYRRKKPRQARQ